MFANDAGQSGNSETGYWHGYDSSGILVDEGVPIRGEGDAISSTTRKFDLQTGEAIQRLALSAMHYNSDPATASSGDNSDFTILRLEYAPVDDDPLI